MLANEPIIFMRIQKLERLLSGYDYLLPLERIRVQLQAPTYGGLQSPIAPVLRRSDALFWTLWTLYTRNAHAYIYVGKYLYTKK